MLKPPPRTPAVELDNGFLRALWRTAVRQDKLESGTEFTDLTNSWFADERWPGVETAYGAADEGLRSLGEIGPLHRGLAPRFRRQAPGMFLFVGYFTAKGGGDPLIQIEPIMRGLAGHVAYGRAGAPVRQWVEDMALMTVYESDWQGLQGLILEGAGTDLAEHQKESLRLKKELSASLAQSWRRFGLSRPLPPLRYRNCFGMIKADGKSQGIIGAQVNMNEAGDSVFVQVSLPMLALAKAIAQHRELPAAGLSWDPCLASKAPISAEHIVLHEVVHALSADTGYTDWSGQGWQGELSAAKARAEELYEIKIHKFWRLGLTELPYPRRINGSPAPALSVPLHFLNEAVAEAATLDLLGLPDPDHRAISVLNRGFVYNPGIKLTRLLLDGRSPLEILLSRSPVTLLTEAIREKMTAAGSAQFLDFLFEQSARFVERIAEAQKLMPKDAPQDLFSLVYYPLITLWERDARRQRKAARAAHPAKGSGRRKSAAKGLESRDAPNATS